MLARALAPEVFDLSLTQLEHRLDDPECICLIKRGHPTLKEGSWVIWVVLT